MCAVGIGLFGLAVDQLVKLACLTYLEPGRPVEVLGPLVRLHLISNPGAAFGLGGNATIVFSLLAIVATAGCVLVGLPRITRGWHAVVLGLLLAGIGGNLVDRLLRPPAPLHGHVVDMFQLPYFAIFNVADVCITMAAAMMFIHSFREGRGGAVPS